MIPAVDPNAGTVNVIGDVAGRHATLLRLLEAMPPAELTVLAGDLVDRGPANLAVLELVRGGRTPQGGALTAVFGNHEFMMLEGMDADARSLERSQWTRNGGNKTQAELLGKSPEYITGLFAWLRTLPVFYQTEDGLLVTHAPVLRFNGWNAQVTDPVGFTWNRSPMQAPLVDAATGQRLFNAYGHNGRFRLHQDDAAQPFAACVDDSHNSKLVGLTWPELRIHSIDGVD